MPFRDTRAALSRITQYRPSNAEQRIALELAAALLQLVDDLERRLDKLQPRVWREGDE
jgi:hypothetical protein